MKRREMLGVLGTGAAGTMIGREALGQHPAAKGEELPVGQFHLALCAFHVAKNDPKNQVEAHHFCSQIREGVHQCIIFDSREKGARILGVEYIVSNEIYQKLPEEEKKYYHPHTYEITAGLLMVPGMPTAEEDALMGYLITTWGKTWHTWPDPKTALPMGDPLLMWAFTEDGQIDPALVTARDRKLQISTSGIKTRRASVVGLGGKPKAK